jgi:hypothetical protein
MKIKEFRFTGQFPNFEVHTVLDAGGQKTNDINIGNLEYVGTLDEKQLKNLIQLTVQAHQEPKQSKAMSQIIGQSL